MNRWKDGTDTEESAALWAARANAGEGKAWFAAWERTQNAAAREQGYAGYEHALVATDYKRRRYGR